MRFVGLLLLAGLGACTSTVKVQPSAAILETRAAASERIKHAHDPAACVDPRSIQEDDTTTVRFLFMTADLDVLGARALDRAAAFARCDTTATIVLVGQAEEGHGTPEGKQALIGQRIATMRQTLTAAGVPEARISTAASAPAATTGPLVLLGRNLGG